jgi:hypothetical protein
MLFSRRVSIDTRTRGMIGPAQASRMILSPLGQFTLTVKTLLAAANHDPEF